MISLNINKICFAAGVASTAVLLASGCGTTGGLRRTADVRNTATLEAGSPRLMVNGPVRLLHVDVYGRETVEVYRVKRGMDGTLDCSATARSAVRQLQGPATNELNLVVGEEEGICLVNQASGAASRTEVSWHALRAIGVPIEIAHAYHASHHVYTEPSSRS